MCHLDFFAQMMFSRKKGACGNMMRGLMAEGRKSLAIIFKAKG